MKVAIVGAGIAGLSLAWALHKRGVAVALFDQGAIPNPVASSVDDHRITRHTYGDLSGYGDLMPHAFAAYDRLWADLGTSHYLPTGMAYIARTDIDWHGAAAEELDRLKISHRSLSLGEIAERLPMIRQEGIVSAFEAGGAGMLFAGRIVADLARWLAEQSVDLHAHSRVEQVDPDAGYLIANGVRHDADVVVIAAGAWLQELYPAAAGRMVPSRQTLLYLKPPAALADAWAKAPVIVDQGSGHGAYILPPRNGTRLKIGDHTFTRIGTGSDDRIASAADIAPVRTAAEGILAQFGGYQTLETKVCYYTVTDDERFVVEPIGAAGWVFSACSGHGFKLGPVIAAGLADALIGARPTEEIPAWAAARG
jgi:sarcosine oxidase/sarcosine oxidase subunit beta